MPRRIIAGFGLFMLGLGLYVVVSPAGLSRFAETFLSPTGLWVAVALRLTVGALMWMAAESSRTPRVFRVLGLLVVISGLSLPVIGLARMESMAVWGVIQGDLLLRGMGLMVTVGGAFLVWSTMSRRGEG